jgi:hypothetical protein
MKNKKDPEAKKDQSLILVIAQYVKNHAKRAITPNGHELRN